MLTAESVASPGNEIKFMVSNAGQSETFYSLEPIDANFITENLLFSGSMNIISSFSISTEALSMPDDYFPILSEDDRDFDAFNVYNKNTSANFAGNASDRNCDTPGTGENEGWCFLDQHFPRRDH